MSATGYVAPRDNHPVNRRSALWEGSRRSNRPPRMTRSPRRGARIGQYAPVRLVSGRRGSATEERAPSDCRQRIAGAIARALALAAVAMTGPACSSTGGSAGPQVSKSSFCTQNPGATCLDIDHSRFVVGIGPQVESTAQAVGVPIDSVVTEALDHIAAILPGPATDIGIALGTQVIPELGVTGYTSPTNGKIYILVDPHSQTPYNQTLRVWLPAALSHEVHHSVRILGGPGFGPTLGESLVTEGLATAFDSQAWPGLTEPWMNAISPAQEAVLWVRMKQALNTAGVAVYDQWFFGSPGIPRWTGFTIGYHMVSDYLRRHPHDSSASIVDLPASTIITGSGYSP